MNESLKSTSLSDIDMSVTFSIVLEMPARAIWLRVALVMWMLRHVDHLYGAAYCSVTGPGILV